MAKKPFAIRVEETESDKFKALVAISGRDSATMFSVLINEFEKQLNDKEREAYQSLLKLWEATHE